MPQSHLLNVVHLLYKCANYTLNGSLSVYTKCMYEPLNKIHIPIKLLFILYFSGLSKFHSIYYIKETGNKIFGANSYLLE